MYSEITKSKFCLFTTDYGQSLTVSMRSDLSDRNSNLQLLEFLFLYRWV